MRCGAVVCRENEVCCGPAECGRCINVLSGAACEDTCPGSGGSGGACTGTAPAYDKPSLERSCTTSNDCFLGVHTADCCGSELAVSYNRSELERFVDYESTCVAACACPSSAPRAEDGSPLGTITDAVAECVSGQCLARGPEHAGECLESGWCIGVEAEGACLEATGSLGTGWCRTGSGVCAACICAAPDTPIATPRGERAIRSLRPGDLVYSVEGEAIVEAPLARVSRTEVVAHEVVEVTLATGSVLRISAGHPTADGRSFGDLRTGGSLDGTPIVSVRRIHYPLPHTFDILPATSTGTYFAGGVLIGSTLR